MNINRRLFYFLLFLLFLLAAGTVYVLRPTSAAQTKADALFPSASAAAPASPTKDFTVMLDYPSHNVPSARDILQRPAPLSAALSSQTEAPAAVLPRSAGRFIVPLSGPDAAAPSQPKTVFPAPRTEASAGAARREVRRSATGYKPSVRMAAPAFSAGQRDGGAGAAGWQADDGAGEDVLSSFFPQQTRKEQKELDRRLQNFSSALEEAVARAFLPKSKRERNIEKYLARARGEKAVMDNEVYGAKSGQLESPEQQVLQQIAKQAKGIVNDVRSSYGEAAASKAQSVMNDFQKEMEEVMNSPADPQEKQIRAQAVNNKYNQKLHQLNQDESLKKMETQLRAENEEYLQKLSQAYGDTVSAAARGKLEENLAQRMAVYSTPQSAEDATRQLLDLEEKKKKDIEEIIRANLKEGAASGAAGKIVGIQNELTENDINNKVQELLDGKREARPYREGPEDRKPYQEEWAAEAKSQVEAIRQIAPQYAAEAESLFKELAAYRNQIRDAALENGTDSYLMLQDDMKKTKQIQEKLQDIQTRAGEDFLNQQNDQRLQEMKQKIPLGEDLKEQWAQKARPIMEKYNKQRIQLNSLHNKLEEYEKAMKQLDEQEMKELQNVQISVPNTPAQ